jgi:hypothetical protein
MTLGLIAGITTVLWIIGMGLYVYTSRRQRDLQGDIESLQQLLDQTKSDES